MSIETQIRTIQALGYSQPEGQFLRLVALHSASAIRSSSTNCSARGHVVREIFREDRHLFRMQSKMIYEALGEEDNRNRREHQPSTVRLRLMGLDFILEHPEHRYLMTQEERLSYFLRAARHRSPEHCPRVSFDPIGQLRPAISRMDSHSLWMVVVRATYRSYTSTMPSSASDVSGRTRATTGIFFRLLARWVWFSSRLHRIDLTLGKKL